VTKLHLWLLAACAAVAVGCSRNAEPVLTFSGSVVGREADILRTQIGRFRQLHPSMRVEIRATPDAADQRHQLYVQWLNAQASEPDVLQLDVVWTTEFAAAGWIAPLDRFAPPADDFFPVAIAPHRWKGSLFALPWFVDVGMLYRRTDVVPRAPRDLDDLNRLAREAMAQSRIPFGVVWQGARYEGLVTTFLEYLGGFGGAILDANGRVIVDSDAGVRALTFMRDSIYADHVVPPAVLTWQEEQTRFAFQNGQAAFMRNWPYAYAPLEDGSQSRVAGRVAVGPMPGGNGGTPTAALGGSALAINAHSDQPDDAYLLITYLLQPAQMIERARVVGQFPPRPALYHTRELADALPIPLADVLAVIEHATPRPVTPVYNELSELLQVSLHRALTNQQSPRDALREAAAAMRALLARVQLAPAS
jgi:ABC-type glycerol-3-phosphate transport system substrate-binding protein